VILISNISSSKN